MRLIILTFLLVISCGENDIRNYDCLNGCSNEWDEETGKSIEYIRGPRGPKGPEGAPGKDGATGPAGVDGRPGDTGDPGTDGKNGTNGHDGLSGEVGPRGEPGSSCTVESVGNGALITCGDSAVAVYNGEHGDDAPSSMYQIESIYDPCGDSPGFDEVVLVLADGTYLAWLKNVGLVSLTPGNYITTDDSKCPFTIGG